MKSIIPYTKTISFGSKIAEITSMSLEYELEKSQEEIKGNFIISGDYRSHEVSVNREPFLHKLPFSIEITDQIDLDSVQFEITDFSYDVVNDETVEIDIEFSIEAEEVKEDVVPEVIEEILEPSTEEERTIFTKVEDPISNVMDLVEPKIETLQEEKQEEVENFIEPDEVEEERNEDMKESEETVINHINPSDDSYATYHIHIVKEGENIETICTMYQSNLNLLTDYNDFNELNTGDKIIIPKEDE